jgi:predicted nucleic acid-binding protein
MTADAGLAFVDPNVLRYAYDPHAGARHERAAALVGDLGRQRAGSVSVQVLQEFYVNATRKIAEPLETDTAIARIRVAEPLAASRTARC